MKTASDFFPGEFQKKLHVRSDKSSAQSIIDGLRSGNTWIVKRRPHRLLDFKVNGAMMGQFGEAKRRQGEHHHPPSAIRRVRTPTTPTPVYTNPTVDHVDIIAGSISGKIAPGAANYSNARIPRPRWSRASMRSAA